MGNGNPGFYTPSGDTPQENIANLNYKNVIPDAIDTHFNNDIDEMLSEIADEIDNDYGKTDSKLHQNSTGRLSFVPQQNCVRKITEIFTYKRQLGHGASGRVVLAENKMNRVDYALKEMQKHQCINKLRFATEHKILNKLRHKNILSLDSTYIDKNCYFLCFPYQSGGTMLDRILEKGSFCESECAEFIKNVLNGLKYMHDNNIVHRDIKCENLIFDSKGADGIVKIIDFGGSEIIVNPDAIDNKIIGSLHYLPPELLSSNKRTKQMLYKGDLWALGVVCYILVTGKVPFYGSNQSETLNAIRKGKFVWPSQINLSDSCKDVISGLLCRDLKKRLDCDSALMHEWISTKGKAVNTLFGDEYFDAVEILSKTNKLQKILVNAVLSEMDTKKKHILLKAMRNLNMNGNEEINQDQIINYILMHDELFNDNKETISGSQQKDVFSDQIIEDILDEMDKMNECECESDSESDGAFVYIDNDEDFESEQIKKHELNFYDFTSVNTFGEELCDYKVVFNDKISVTKFSSIISGAEHKYDIKALIDRLKPTVSGNIRLKNINAFKGPLHSIASNNGIMNDVVEIGLNMSNDSKFNI